MTAISLALQDFTGMTWPTWQRLIAETEALGFAGIFCSDHFPRGQPRLEMIVALTYVATQTEQVHFGPLVSPLSYRDPALLARQAVGLNDLSQGRMILGVGTGWQEDEHVMWGYDLGELSTRFARFEEGLEVLTRLLRSDDPVTYEGHFFQLHEATLSEPQGDTGPQILIGGNGLKRTMPLVARYADIWNANNLTLDAFRQRSAHLDGLLQQAGRQPNEIKRTAMNWVICGRDEADLKRRLTWLHPLVPELADLSFAAQLEELKVKVGPAFERAGAMFAPIAGTPDQVIDQIRAYAEAGLEELIVQWFDLDDSDGLRLLAEAVLPALK